MEKKEKQCQLCGDMYIPTGHNQKRCSECQKKYYRIYQHNYAINHREYRSNYMKQYYSDSDNYEKHKIRTNCNNKAKSGQIAKASRCCASGCKCTDNLELHHVNYGDGIEAMATITLCRKHHRQLHKSLRMNKQRKYIRQSITASVKVM